MLLTNTLLTTRYQLGERLNRVGLSQPNITVDLNKQHIYIEMPGAKNPDRIRSIVTSTASLEFWDTYRITDVGMVEAFVAADQLLSNTQQ